MRTLGTVLKTLPHSRVSLRKEGDDVCLAAATSEVRLAGFDVEEFPDVNPPQERLAAIPLAGLARQQGGICGFAGRDPLYLERCVHVEVGAAGLKLVATDGHRLAHYQAASLPPGSVLDADLEEPVTGIVPVRLLLEGVRLGSQFGSTATLELYEKSACIQVNGSVMLWADLIDGQYPVYEGVIPSEYSGCVTIGNGALGSAVSRLVALSKGCRDGACPPGGRGWRDDLDGGRRRFGRLGRRASDAIVGPGNGTGLRFQCPVRLGSA